MTDLNPAPGSPGQRNGCLIVLAVMALTALLYFCAVKAGA